MKPYIYVRLILLAAIVGASLFLYSYSRNDTQLNSDCGGKDKSTKILTPTEFIAWGSFLNDF